MSKTAEVAWAFVFALLGITALALVGSFLLGRPHHYNIIGKVWVHFIGFCALNEPDKPSVPVGAGVRLLIFLAGVFVVPLVWGGLWLVA